MPDAATRIRASPAPAAGFGRSTRRSTSGPPGVAISIAFTTRAVPLLLVRGLARLTVEQSLHRQLDAALLVGLENLDANDLAFLQEVGDLLDTLVRDLA